MIFADMMQWHTSFEMRTLGIAQRISSCELSVILAMYPDLSADAVHRPGWVHTGLTAAKGGPKPFGAWTAEQTVEYMTMRGESQPRSQASFTLLSPLSYGKWRPELIKRT